MLRELGLNELSDDADFAQSLPGKSLAEQPLGFVDVGARGGTHDLIRPIAKNTAVMGFEPDRAEYEKLLKDPNTAKPFAHLYLDPHALMDKSGDVTLHLMSCATNHSLLPPNEGFVQRYDMQAKWSEVGTETCPAITLDEAIKGAPFASAELIKVDTQGTEYEILDGSKLVLASQTVAVVTEVSFTETYQGQKLFSDIERLMRWQGFTFYGFTNGPHTRSKKLLDKRDYATAERIMYADAIFFKDPLPGSAFDVSKHAKLSDRQYVALFTVALLFRYFDFALELAQASWVQNAGGEESERVKRLIYKLAAVSKHDAVKAVMTLHEQVSSNPDKANILVGSFVDERRKLCNYDDVLNVSPLPKVI